MGANVSSSDGSFNKEKSNEVWSQIQNSNKPPDQKKGAIKYSDWRTARLYIASTFKDFKNERELLYSKLVPALEALCEQKKLIFILEDFQAGNNEPFDDPEGVYLIVDALEQCYIDDNSPFYLHMLGDCAGYVLPHNYPDADTAAAFGIAQGMSLMEVSVTVGALKGTNANALFMYRDPNFLTGIPFHQVQFIEDKTGRKRAQFIREKLQSSIPSDRFLTYRCAAEGIDNPHQQHIILKKLDKFAKEVTDFFSKRLDEQFKYSPPAPDKKPVSKWKRTQDDHKQAVLRATDGSDASHGQTAEILDKLMSAIGKSSTNSIYCISGDCGSGKTSTLAQLITKLLPKGKTECSVASPDGSKKPYKVFFHLSTQVAGANSLNVLLSRLLYEIYGYKEASIPGRLDDLKSAIQSALLDPKGRPVILIVDDLDALNNPVSWIPNPLPPQVKLIVTTHRDVNITKTFKHLPKPPEWYRLSHLDKDEAKMVITQYLRHVPRDVVGSRKAAHSRPQTAGRRLVADELTRLAPLKRASIHGSGTTADEEGGTTLGKRIVSAGLGRLRRMSKGDGKTDVEAGAGTAAAGEAKERKAEFTSTKCKILATMLRFGTPLEKVKALAYFNTVAVAEAELMEFEQDLNGHLLIATVCLLAVSKRGLREIELRHLLADEHNLLLEGTKRRNHTNVGYGHSSSFGKLVQPVRWRWVAVRLAHHLTDVGHPGENRLILADAACRRAIDRRYLSKDGGTNGKYWAKKLAALFDKHYYFLVDRKAEELPYHAAMSGDKKKLERSFTDWKFISEMYRPDYSLELFELWKLAGNDMTSIEKPLLHLVLGENKCTSQELEERAVVVANLLKQSGNYGAAAKIAHKAIEIEKGIDGGRQLQLGQLNKLIGDVQHEKGRSTNGLLEWVDWHDVSHVPYVTKPYEVAVDHLKKAGDGKEAKYLLAQCYLRMAFWDNSGKKLSQSGDGSSGVKLCNTAKDIFHELKDNKAEGECYITRANCEQKDEKVIDALSKAEERFVKANGDCNFDLLRVYASGIKLLPGAASHPYIEKAKNLNKKLHQATDKERLENINKVIDDLSKGAQAVAVDL